MRPGCASERWQGAIRFTWTYPGQIRSADISLWERHGFASDDYYTMLMRVSVADWAAPPDLDLTGVTVEDHVDLVDTLQFLNTECENRLTDEFEQWYFGGLSSQSFDTIVQMAAEGFDYENITMVRLTRPIDIEAS